MTNAEKARDLAEKVMGWTNKGAGMRGGFFFLRDGKETHGTLVGELEYNHICWDPFTSRDDLAELLERLTDEQKLSVCDYLARDFVGRSFNWYLLTATPAQVAEAVWRATCQ